MYDVWALAEEWVYESGAFYNCPIKTCKWQNWYSWSCQSKLLIEIIIANHLQLYLISSTLSLRLAIIIIILFACLSKMCVCVWVVRAMTCMTNKYSFYFLPPPPVGQPINCNSFVQTKWSYTWWWARGREWNRAHRMKLMIICEWNLAVSSNVTLWSDTRLKRPTDRTPVARIGLFDLHWIGV